MGVVGFGLMVWAMCRMGAMGVVGEGWMGVGSRVPLGVDVARVLGGFGFWCFSGVSRRFRHSAHSAISDLKV